MNLLKQLNHKIIIPKSFVLFYIYHYYSTVCDYEHMDLLEHLFSLDVMTALTAEAHI